MLITSEKRILWSLLLRTEESPENFGDWMKWEIRMLRDFR